jgi:hypothetical protein
VITASAKNKGRIFQQWVRDLILRKFPELGVDDVRSTGMGQQGADLQLSTYAKSILPIEIECKSLTRQAVYKHYAQAAAHGPGEPVVVLKQNRGVPLAVVRAEYLFELLSHGW